LQNKMKYIIKNKYDCIMKKIMFVLIAVISIVANYSCSNDDIDITRNVTIKVNTGNVLTNYDGETQDNLSSLNSNRYVRATILLYDQNGTLVKGLYKTETSYKTSTFSLEGIPDGTYTLISVTDIVESSSTASDKSTFWSFSNLNNISTATISCLKNYDDTNLGIGVLLGVASQKITINNANKEFITNPSPAGSLIRVEFHNIHAWASTLNVSDIDFVSGKFSNSLNFDINGGFVKNFNTKYYYTIRKINLSDHTDDLNDKYYYYGYAFHLSGTQIPVNFLIYFDNNSSHIKASDDDKYVDFGDGDLWVASIDLSEGTWDCSRSTSGQKSIASLAAQKLGMPTITKCNESMLHLAKIGH